METAIRIYPQPPFLRELLTRAIFPPLNPEFTTLSLQPETLLDSNLLLDLPGKLEDPIASQSSSPSPCREKSWKSTCSLPVTALPAESVISFHFIAAPFQATVLVRRKHARGGTGRYEQAQGGTGCAEVWALLQTQAGTQWLEPVWALHRGFQVSRLFQTQRIYSCGREVKGMLCQPRHKQMILKTK